MKTIAHFSLALIFALPIFACGDQKESADRAAEAQKAIQQGMQKEKSMMEGMVKGVETMEKKMTDAKQETKK
jgi:hypothetical protein